MTASAVFQTPPRYRMTPQTTSSKTFIETHLSSIITPELKDQITDVYTEILELSQELDEIATTEGKRQDDSFYEKCGDLEAHTTSLIKDIELKGPFEGRDVLMAFAYAAVLYQCLSSNLSKITITLTLLPRHNNPTRILQSRKRPLSIHHPPPVPPAHHGRCENRAQIPRSHAMGPLAWRPNQCSRRYRMVRRHFPIGLHGNADS